MGLAAENTEKKPVNAVEVIEKSWAGKDTTELDYHSLNAMLNLYNDEGKIQFDMDRKAARQFFLQHVNQNTVFFHNLEEKLGHLVIARCWSSMILISFAAYTTMPTRRSSDSLRFLGHISTIRAIP